MLALKHQLYFSLSDHKTELLFLFLEGQQSRRMIQKTFIHETHESYTNMSKELDILTLLQ